MVFVIICRTLPFVDWIIAATPNNSAAQIANIHTIFNVVTTMLLLPFGTLLEKLAKLILPETQDEYPDTMKLCFISPASLITHSIGSVSIAISQIKNEIQRMYSFAINNVESSFDHVIDFNEDSIAQIEKNEEYVDYLNAEISKYISSILSGELTENDAQAISSYFKIIGNIERISDHAVNILEYGTLLHKKENRLSKEAYDEIREMKTVVLADLEYIDFSKQYLPLERFLKIGVEEEKIDLLTDKYRSNQLNRMCKGECSGDISVIYSELITDFERIGDHMLNIAEYMVK